MITYNPNNFTKANLEKYINKLLKNRISVNIDAIPKTKQYNDLMEEICKNPISFFTKQNQ